MDELKKKGQFLTLIPKSIDSRIRDQIKEEIIKLAKTYNITSSLPVEFDNAIIKLIEGEFILGSLYEAWRCYSIDSYTAGCIMLRKTLETSIHIGFMRKFGNDDLLKNQNGEYYKLKKKLEIIRGKDLASSSVIDTLITSTKLMGDIGAHNFKIGFLNFVKLKPK